MTTLRNDVQGRIFGILPFDFRMPTLAKAVARVWQPGGPMLVPKVFGAGWTLNLAHRGSQLLLAASLGFALAAILLS